MTNPSIYVADLAAYNNGILHGTWIDATGELADIQEQVQKMLADSPEPDAEGYAIHDYEGFGSYRLSEYEGLESAHEIANFISEYPDFGDELLNYYSDIDEARRMALENFHGCFESLADYARESIESMSSVPAHLEFYIDYEKMGRDWELSGDLFTVESGYNKVYVFSNH